MRDAPPARNDAAIAKPLRYKACFTCAIPSSS